MNVDVRVVRWLREQKHDATHLRDEGLHRIPNGEIFAKAISEHRVILTFDLDFGEIVALCKGKRTSVIVFRLHNTRTPHVIDRLAAVLADSATALEEGAVVVVEESRHRVRHFPAGGMGGQPWSRPRNSITRSRGAQKRSRSLTSTLERWTSPGPPPRAAGLPREVFSLQRISAPPSGIP